MNSDSRSFFTQNVWPQVAAELKTDLNVRYPAVRLGPEPGYTALAEMPVCMVIGLTGTGKTTTLEQLAAMRETGSIQYNDDIPTRRELADLVIIPTAQVIGGEAVAPVKDRQARFGYTGQFAAAFDNGGSAAAYGWLYYQWDGHTPLLSDGLRGPGEIAYALAHNPRWRIIELWVDPVTRLQRLTDRNDTFDQVANAQAALDLSFLNAEQQGQVRQLLAQGDISPKAVITARAEAENYGAEPFDATSATPNYYCLRIDGLTPVEVAAQVVEFMRG